MAGLIHAATLAAREIDLLQALLHPDDHDCASAYLTAGFQSLTLLNTMLCGVPRRAVSPELPEGLSLSPTTDHDLLATLEATYVDTLDCPGLRGLRRTADIVAGHRASGVVHDDLWLAVRQGGDMIGCVLVTCGPNHTADLAYLGLTPPHRGRGIGPVLLQEVMRRLSHRRVKTLRLAVDSRNQPALNVYGAAGFVTRATQRAVIRSTVEVQAT